MAELTGSVLAGGRSSRMGADKASLMLDGVSLLQRCVDRLAPLVDELVLVGAPGRPLPSVVSDLPIQVLEDPVEGEGKRYRTRFLPDNIHDAIRLFKTSRLAADIIGDDAHAKYIELKQRSADRCPKELGTLVKREEVMFHHEVTNQWLWNQF